MNTTLAIPIWKDQLSTTFDFAHELLIVEADGSKEISRKELSLNDESIAKKVREMRNAGVQVLLCGAVSRPLAGVMAQAGIQVIPFVTGNVDDVLAAYFCGRLDKPCFLQPGCRAGARRRWRQGRQFFGAGGRGIRQI